MSNEYRTVHRRIDLAEAEAQRLGARVDVPRAYKLAVAHHGSRLTDEDLLNFVRHAAKEEQDQ